MHFLILVLSVLLFFRVEVFSLFVGLSLIQWLLLLSISFMCLPLNKRKIKYSFIFFARKTKPYNLVRYWIKISKWAKEIDTEEMGRLIVSRLERNVFTKLGCTVLSMTIFNHYPILLTSPTPATIFLLTITAYSLIGLAFRKEMLIFMVGIYSLMAIMPYCMAFLSHETGINLFETLLPTDVVYLLDIDLPNLTQTATKLFLFTAPGSMLIILFLIVSSVIINISIKQIFTIFQKVLQSINPA